LNFSLCSVLPCLPGAAAGPFLSLSIRNNVHNGEEEEEEEEEEGLLTNNE
jgi:hypothetical protein